MSYYNIEEKLQKWKSQKKNKISPLEDFNYTLDIDEDIKEEILNVYGVTEMELLSAINFEPKENLFNDDHEIQSIKKRVYSEKELYLYMYPAAGAALKNIKDCLIKLKHKLPSTMVEVLLNEYQAKLLHDLKVLSSRVLIVEFHREKYDSIEHFYKRIMDDKTLFSFIKSEYLVLFKQASISISHFEKNHLVIIERLIKDVDELIKSKLIDSNITGLKTVKVGVGDYHKKGQSVLIFIFNNGCKVLYKPKDLSIDEQLSSYLDHLNKSLSHYLKIPRIINKGLYGWVEFIEFKECKSIFDVKNYYTKMSLLTCIFYMLKGSDLHYENLIANGSDPYFIDIESIFCPSMTKAGDFRKNLLNESIHSLSILPNRLRSNTTMSAMCNVEKEKEPSTSLDVDKSNNDFRIKEKQRFLTNGKNVPKLNGIKVNYKKFHEEFVNGFTEAYIFFLKNQKLEKELINRMFKGIKVRVIFKNTSDYSLIIRDCFHPKYCLDATKRDLHLFNLWNIAKKDKKFAQLVRSEIKDINNLDVPFFYSKCDSKAIYDSDDKLLSNDFFTESGIEFVRKRMDILSKEDLERQLFLIKISIFGYNIEESSYLIANRLINYKLDKPEEIFGEVNNDRRIKNIIVHIADRLVNLRKESKTDCDWDSFIIKDNYIQMGNRDFSMFSGSVGKLYYLAWAGSQYGNKEHLRVAKIALDSFLGILYNSMGSIKLSSGLYYGWSGIILLLANLPLSFKTTSISRAIHHILDKLMDTVSKDNDNDVMYGNAGLIISLYFINDNSFKQKINKIIEFAGSRLLNNLNIEGDKISWGIESLDSKNQVRGYSHGNSGVALALFILQKVTNDAKFYDLLQKSLMNERVQLNFYSENNIETSVKNTSLTTGSAGILLSRIYLKRLGFNDSLIDKEMEVLANNLLKDRFNENHSIATGSLSHLEILREYKNFDLKWNSKDYFKEKLINIITEIEKGGFKTNNNIHLDDLSLFNGICGIGYQLMREVFPNTVPSIIYY